MKKFGPTLIMAVLALAMGGFAFYEYKTGQQEESKKAEENRLFSEADANFTAIAMTTGIQSHFDLAKEGEKSWQILAPLKDASDDSAIQAFAGELGGQKAKEIEVEGKPNWQQYGLDDSAPKMILTNSNKKTYTILISSKPAFDGSYFLKMNDKLLLGSSAWGRFVQKNVNDFRDKAFISESLMIKGFVIEHAGHGKFEIKKTDTGWEISGKTKLPADTKRIESFIKDLKGLRALDFTSEDQNAKVMNSTGLRTPQIRITLQLDDKNLPRLDLAVASKDENAFAMVSNRPQVFKIPKTNLEKLDHAQDYFRDRTEPFRFPLEQAVRLRIETPATKLEVQKDGSTWKLAQPEPGKELDVDRLQDFYSKLKSMEADAFFSPQTAAKGLTPAKNLIAITDSQNKEIFRMSWGEQFKKDKESVPLFYTKTSQTKDVLGVKTGSIMALPINSLLKTSSAPKPASSVSITK